jgi:hypothetical protein
MTLQEFKHKYNIWATSLNPDDTECWDCVPESAIADIISSRLASTKEQTIEMLMRNRQHNVPTCPSRLISAWR